MTPAELANVRMVADAMEFSGVANLNDDALIYAGSATWDRWENHVPQILVKLWPSMTEESRLCVYLTAKAVTMFQKQPAQ